METFRSNKWPFSGCGLGRGPRQAQGGFVVTYGAGSRPPRGVQDCGWMKGLGYDLRGIQLFPKPQAELSLGERREG